MGERISWAMTVQVSGGQKIELSRTLDVHAYDKVSIPVPGETESSAAVRVEVQPTDGEGQVQFLLIYADHYDTEGQLTFEVRDATTGDTTHSVQLDGPQVLIGPGAVGLLGDTPPHDLFFVNTLTREVKIDILVGRDATETS